jgi:hypothetical protein
LVFECTEDLRNQYGIAEAYDVDCSDRFARRAAVEHS